jgi:hypothetical protein
LEFAIWRVAYGARVCCDGQNMCDWMVVSFRSHLLCYELHHVCNIVRAAYGVTRAAKKSVKSDPEVGGKKHCSNTKLRETE